MKISHLLNDPKIKIVIKNIKSDSVERVLTLQDLDLSNPLIQIKLLLHKIKTKFFDGGLKNIKILNDDPFVFNLIPEFGTEYFQVTISFPKNMSTIRNTLINSITSFLQ
jgi:hypothetical protein